MTSSTSFSIEDKRSWIADKLDALFASKTKFELVSLDFEINLMICAAQSYKHETVMKPFPSTFLSESNNDKNHDQLLKALKSLPPVCEWKSKVNKFSKEQLSVVYWLFMHDNFLIEYNTQFNDEEKLQQLAKYSGQFTKPNHLFEVKYSEEKIRKFEMLKQQASEKTSTPLAEMSSFSFHGTRMDNIYSILHCGLLSHFSKNALFGEGTYLSQEPSMCLHYSPGCSSWNKSLLGQRMSCVLLCETINDPQHVKVGVKENTDATDNRTKSRSQVPEKYFVVSNNDYVRVRYVLLYADKTKIKKQNKLVQLINENRFALLLICYSLLLLFISLMNSRTFHKYIKTSYRLLSNYLLGEATSSIE